MKLCFELNGRNIECEAKENQVLLDLLRVDLGVTSVKKGCESGECGACTILLDGKPVTSCMILAPQVEGRKVTTLDGLLDEPRMEKLRQAFLEGGAIQCGFCTPGMLISAYALLKENPKPTADEVKKAIEGNLCRCTGYVNIIKAIIHASQHI
jgi:carbon-monoxide dehydrogenase small subunit